MNRPSGLARRPSRYGRWPEATGDAVVDAITASMKEAPDAQAEAAAFLEALNGEGFVVVTGLSCHRCGRSWVPRNEDKPRVCPSCKSPYWDRPRRTP